MSDYYAVLGISAKTDAYNIREAYKRAALKTHPDRFPPGSREAQVATANFQEVNEAYYVLSDKRRRAEYDRTRPKTEKSDNNPFKSFDSTKTNKGNPEFKYSKPENASEYWSDEQFASVFEDLLREEGLGEEDRSKQKAKKEKTSHYYAYLGMVGGSLLGFIVGNVPGAVAAAGCGALLGKIRDDHNQSVAEVFRELPYSEKVRLISTLAFKVLGTSSSDSFTSF